MMGTPFKIGDDVRCRLGDAWVGANVLAFFHGANTLVMVGFSGGACMVPLCDVVHQSETRTGWLS